MIHRLSAQSSHLIGCLLSALLALTVWAVGFAQTTRGQDTGTITGQVIDRQTQEPLPDINVVVAGTLFGAATDAEGSFRIEGLPPDTHTVQVSALGYRMARRSVTLAAGETVQITFRLTPTAEEAAAEVVDPTTPALQPLSVLDRQALREADVADLGAALRDASSGGAIRRGVLGFDPVVQGLAGAQLGVFIDGLQAVAGSPLRTDSPLGVLDPTMAERLTVVKGPYALMHGGGALSALRVETPGLDDPTARTGVVQGGFRGNGSVAETAAELQGRAFGASYRMQGIYRSGRDYTTGAEASVPASYTAGGAHGRVDVPLTGVSTLSMRGAVLDQRDVDYPGRTLNAEAVRSGYGALHYVLNRGSGLIRRMEADAYAAQRLHRLNNDDKLTADAHIIDGVPSPGLQITADAELVNLGGRWSAQFAPISGWRITAGADGYQSNRVATRLLRLRGTGGIPPYYSTSVVWPDATQRTIGAFTNATRALGPIDVSGTVRLDWMQSDADGVSAAFLQIADVTSEGLEASTVAWSGAFTLATELTPQWTASAGVGSAVRPPSALERYADRFPASGAFSRVETLGNPMLDPERSAQADVWLRGAFERGALHVNGFARRISDFITLAPSDVPTLLPSSPEPVYRYMNGTATFYGVDASGRFVVNPLLALSGRMGYVWGQNETRDEPAPHVAPFNGAVGARVEAPFNENLFLDVTTRFAAAHDRVSPVWGEMPTDGYAVLDLRLGLALASNATLMLRAENLTDVQYTYPLNATNPFTDVPLFEPGRTLGIGLRVTF